MKNDKENWHEKLGKQKKTKTNTENKDKKEILGLQQTTDIKRKGIKKKKADKKTGKIEKEN